MPPTMVCVISGNSRLLKSRFDMTLAADFTGMGLLASSLNRLA